MNRAGFTYKRPSELILWLWVYCRSPFIPSFFRKDLFYKVREYISWQISINLNSPKLTLVNRLYLDIHTVTKQRQIVDSWINQSFTQEKVPLRHGKTTLIAELVKSIPDDLSILIIVVGFTNLCLMRILIGCDRRNCEVIAGTRKQKAEYDFVFVEGIKPKHISTEIAIGKTLVLYY